MYQCSCVPVEVHIITHSTCTHHTTHITHHRGNLISDEIFAYGEKFLADVDGRKRIIGKDPKAVSWWEREGRRKEGKEEGGRGRRRKEQEE